LTYSLPVLSFYEIVLEKNNSNISSLFFLMYPIIFPYKTKEKN
jgi:hypothetical protein